MYKKLTNLRWLISIMLVAFWVTGFSQTEPRNLDEKAASAIEASYTVFTSNQITPSSNRETEIACPTSLNEGFETASFPPTGWTRINGGDANTWVSSTSTPHSGVNCARITYSATAHNDWLITPQLLPGPGNNTISFWAKNYSLSYIDRFNVKLSTTGKNEADFTVTLASNIGPGTAWTQYSYNLSAYNGQAVYVAVQAISTDQWYLFLDDFVGPNIYSYFNGATALDYGTTFDLGVYQRSYDVTNCGVANLNVALSSASPEISVAGLPISLAPGATSTLNVTFNPSVAGAYNGSFVMSTNDPFNASVPVAVTSTVVQATVSSSLFEDFNAIAAFAMPANWLGNFSVRDFGGLNDSKRFTRNLWGATTSRTGQFSTPFVELLDNNYTLKFNYRAVNYTSYPTVPTPAANFAFTVYMSLDFGTTFTPVYTYNPADHTPSLNYKFVEIPLGVYAGGTAFFTISSEALNSADLYLDFDDFLISTIPGMAIRNPILDLGYRPIGAWMEPALYEIVNNAGAGDFVITAADIDNNVDGFIDVLTPALPYTLGGGELTTEFGLTNDVAAITTPGAFSGTFAIIYSGINRAALTATYSGTAYTPLSGDVWENAIDMGVFAAPLAATELTRPETRELFGLYKNYILPNDLGTGVGDLDMVFTITLETDKLFSLYSTYGVSNFAIYAEDFNGEGGPMATNALVQELGGIYNFPLFAGTYYLVTSGIGDFDAWYNVTAMPAPGITTYLDPADGAINITNGDMLEWTFGANVFEYQLILGTTYPPATVVVDWTSDLTESYELAGLEPNLQYFWQVNVRNSNGTTNGPVWGFTTTIDVPTGLTVTVVDPAPTAPLVSAELTWTGTPNRAFIGYNVYRNGVKITATPQTGTTYTDLGLARNTSYTYRVSTVFDEGESALSTAVTVTTKGVGTFNGFVYDFLTNDPIEGATVRVANNDYSYSVQTGLNGSYTTLAYAGNYGILVTASGYTGQNLTGQLVAHGGTTTNSFYMMEMPLPVGEVTATELSSDAVQISWDGSGAEPPIEEWLLYDIDLQGFGGIGAEALDYSLIWASKFVPEQLVQYGTGYVTKVAVYQMPDVGDYLTEVRILSGDGTTVLYSQNVTGTLVGDQWNIIELDQDVEFDNTENLWIAMYVERPGGTFNEPTSDVIQVIADRYDFFAYNGGSWTTITGEYGINYQGWMLRGFVTNTAGREIALGQGDYTSTDHKDYSGATSVPSGLGMIKTTSENAKFPQFVDSSTRGIVSYDVWREKVYQPGSFDLIGNTVQQNFVDFDWGVQDWGVYRWAVTVNYDAGQTSPAAYSNILEKDMYTVVDVTVTTNSGDSPAGTLVTFENISEPDLGLIYDETLDGSGTFTWDQFRKGVYNIDVFKPGYTVQNYDAVSIFDVSSFTWLLEEILATPSGLYVTPTGLASWQGGTSSPFVPLMETFDGGSLPS
jgi:hypothetical protein